MELGLKGKVALVTASSKGTAKVLAREEMKVVISSRNRDELMKARDALAAETGAEVLAIPADMTVREDLEKLVEEAAKKFGGVDVLVYNAGPPKTGTFADLTYPDWEEATKLLLLSAVTMTRAAVPYMKGRGWGRLIYVTSFTLRQPVENLVLSNTVRLAIAGLSKSLSKELGPSGITSNIVIQGYIRTDRAMHLIEQRASSAGTSVDDAYREMAKSIPARRGGIARGLHREREGRLSQRRGVHYRRGLRRVYPLSSTARGCSVPSP
jgi:3-oxoacyl-[acyl-carrier protein] reductase